MGFVYLYSMIQTLVVEPSIARVLRHEWQHHDLVQLKRLINPKYSPHITMHTPIRMDSIYIKGGIKITVFINTKYVLYFGYKWDCFEFSCMFVMSYLWLFVTTTVMIRYNPKKINILSCWQKVAIINWMVSLVTWLKSYYTHEREN